MVVLRCRFESGHWHRFAPLAQLVEQLAHNRPVPGSIPRGGTRYAQKEHVSYASVAQTAEHLVEAQGVGSPKLP